MSDFEKIESVDVTKFKSKDDLEYREREYYHVNLKEGFKEWKDHNISSSKHSIISFIICTHVSSCIWFNPIQMKLT